MKPSKYTRKKFRLLQSQIKVQAASIDEFQTEFRKLYGRLLTAEQEISRKVQRIDELNKTIESVINLKSDIQRIVDEGKMQNLPQKNAQDEQK